MTDREKLIALIKEGECGALALEDCSYCKYDGEDDCSYQLLAYVLIANGVMVREKGEWVFDRVSTVCDFEVVKCSNCGYEAYAQAIHVKHGNFCPNCGADMRKGENG